MTAEKRRQTRTEGSGIEVSTVEMSNPSPERLRRPIIVPEQGSLWDIMHDHQGTSLFVGPRRWTDIHTQLLDCQFIRRTPQENPQPSQQDSLLHFSSRLGDIARDIDALLDNKEEDGTETQALESILSSLFPSHLGNGETSPQIILKFGNRLYKKDVCEQIHFKHHTSTFSRAPILAYIRTKALDRVRRRYFQVGNGPQGNNTNKPVQKLNILKYKTMVPSNLHEDPYFVATAISLAQQRFYLDADRTQKSNTTDITVRLFTLSQEIEAQAFIVYTAKMTSQFLMMFDSPQSRHKCRATRMEIEYQEVPIFPILGLKERLGQALGKELVGDIDTDIIETFPDQKEEAAPPKCRRTTSSNRDESVGITDNDLSKDLTSDGITVVRPAVCHNKAVEDWMDKVQDHASTPLGSSRLKAYQTWATNHKYPAVQPPSSRKRKHHWVEEDEENKTSRELQRSKRCHRSGMWS